ncbi:MAG TPA: TIGR02530 family flagellar biosynthesis protein [Selenomonadales bacterium]|nr:TIGR02530 family flagellar biosynthesis protein [Selenomonadales bacterium]
MSDNRIYYPQQSILPVTKPVTSPSAQQSQRPSAATEASFSQVLQQELSGLKFSNHALQRLQTRNIQLNPAELSKLSSAVDKAAQKGANDSLILMNNLALVVSVKNRTVITAMDGASLKDNVFTNIDSAVIV